jgi:hypothetical protein
MEKQFERTGYVMAQSKVSFQFFHSMVDLSSSLWDSLPEGKDLILG